MKTARVFMIALCATLAVNHAMAQVGTSSRDECTSVSSSNAGAVVVGFTAGSLVGANVGGVDAFVKKYSPSGLVQWTKQFGSAGNDYGLDVAIDVAGNGYVVGVTDGALVNNLGGKDIFLRKYDPAGKAIWTKQFGTALDDSAVEVATDQLGNIFILSQDNLNLPNPGFVIRRFNDRGNVLKRLKVATQNALVPRGLTVDSANNVLILADWVDTGLSGQNVRIYKYTNQLTPVWQKAYQTLASDQGYDIATSGTDILFTAHYGTFGARVIKMNAAGTVQWARSLEPPNATRNGTFPDGIATDALGNVYVAGSNAGESYTGFHNAGFFDVFAFKFDGTGNTQWIIQLDEANHGTEQADVGASISVADFVFVVGSTFGDMQLGLERTLQNEDGFVAGLDSTTGAVLGIDQYLPTGP